MLNTSAGPAAAVLEQTREPGPDAIAGTLDDNPRLLPGSPCIDAGVPAGDAGPQDCAGLMRVVDGERKLGCNERSGCLGAAAPLRGVPIAIHALATGRSTKIGDCPYFPGRRHGRRRPTQFRSRPPGLGGRARTAGSPSRNLRRSSANSSALPYRRRGSFSRHLRQIVSRSRGTFLPWREGGAGHSRAIFSRVSRSESDRKGGLPTRHS